jgi:UDP-N-acetylglucosamine 2-epimerase (non-hydrolysing)
VTRGVTVTGNTVVDALRRVLGREEQLPSELAAFARAGPYILATSHRRESWEAGIAEVADALAAVLDAAPGLRLIFATHPNPLARTPVMRRLGGNPRARIVDSLDYHVFLRLLAGAELAVSDSGGVQEEGPTLGIPVLVTRTVTERPEGVEAGAVRLVGTDRAAVLSETLSLVRDAARRERMAAAGRTIYGDGAAAERIADVLTGSVHGAGGHATTEAEPDRRQ